MRVELIHSRSAYVTDYHGRRIAGPFGSWNDAHAAALALAELAELAEENRKAAVR